MQAKQVPLDHCTVRGVETHDDVLAVADLYGKAFGAYPRNYDNYVDLLVRRVPNKLWRLSRTLWTPDGTPIAHVRVCDRTMRLGGALIRVGGIGDVCTHPARRKRGIMRHLFSRVVDFMRDEPYDISMLWGIGSFYDKFGFITALTDHTLQIPRAQTERLRGPYTARRPKPTDGPAVARLFRGDLAIRDGAMERPGAVWLQRLLAEKNCRLLADPAGRLRACYRGGPEGDAYLLREVSFGARPHLDAFHSLLADMAHQAKACEKPNLRFELHPDHPLGHFITADGCQTRTHIGHRGGGMCRITNLHTLCDRMTPEWEALLAASPAHDWAGRLRLKTDIATRDLAIADGRIVPEPPAGRAPATIACTQDKLTRLVLGFHTPETAMLLGEVRISKPARPLAQALFPRRALTIFGHDRF